MKRLCILAVFLLATGIAFSGANAQDINVYFDSNFTQISKDCQGPMALDTMYVVAENFNSYMLGFEYKLELPPSMIVLGEINNAALKIGSSANGVSLAYSLPQNAFEPVLLATIFFFWNCEDCSVENQQFFVGPNPYTSFIGGARWPDNVLVPANGGYGYVCRRINYYLDIKPGSCPNPFNVQLFQRDEEKMPKPDKGGVMPVAILGSAEFDVHDIDLATIRLEGVPWLERGKGPRFSDVGTPPMDDGTCPCSTEGPDGITDLVMRFLTMAIADAIPQGIPGEVREVTLTGNLLNGEPFEITDCLTFVGPKDKFPVPSGTEPLLSGASPNPFNPLTRIHYFIPEEAAVRLSIYDVQGALVATLVDGVVPEGDHVITWDAMGNASGVYFCRLTTGDFVQTRKMILLK